MQKTILIVDDALSVRGLLKMTLEGSGYKVAEACDGKDALNKVSTLKSLHLIFVDLYMPNMGGMEFIKALKASPKHKFIPIVVLTKESDPAMKREGQAAGAKAWVVKPFKPETIVNVVQKIIG
ncbi:response regulator [Desulfobacterales bacterium HSG16]|nr:response regulator [Desulfobacterales bacterium HSG16]